MLQVRTL